MKRKTPLPSQDKTAIEDTLANLLVTSHSHRKQTLTHFEGSTEVEIVSVYEQSLT